MDERFFDLNRDGDSRSAIMETIQAGRPLLCRLTFLDDAVEHELNFLVAALLSAYEREAMQSTLYSCVKELVVNAVKANAKQVFFRRAGLDIKDREQYARGLARFKKQLDENSMIDLCREAAEAELDVRLRIEHDGHGLRIEVLNQLEISEADESRIRSKFRSGMQYDDLVSFYMDHADDSEGEGIGFALNVLLLKGEQIDPALFRVGVREGRTVARLEIPFSDAFVSVRGENPGGR